MIGKGELRTLKKGELAGMSESERVEKSQIIATRIYDFVLENGFKTVCVYNSFSTEVKTQNLIRDLRASGVTVCVPRINGGDMVTVRLDDSTEFVPNEYGIAEPVGDECDCRLDMIVIPLIAFDENFGRLGRGKGYYDKYLKTHSGLRVAAAFDRQKADCVPVDDMDVKMDVIVTECDLLKRR